MKKRKRRKWTASEDAWLLSEYANRSNADLSMWLHRPPRSIMARAYSLGLHKSPEFAEQKLKKGQFKKNHTPHNKGKSRKYWATPEAEELMSKGQFKPGVCRDDNPRKRPIGHEKVYADGYVWIITEHGRRQKHRVVWEQAHGPIPPGHCVKFKDGNPQNCSLDNLYLVSRADHARETRAALSPEKKAEILRKAKATRDATIRRDKLRLKWGLEPESKLVKRI